MKFGLVAAGEAEGAILAHSLRLGRLVLRKGQRLGKAELEAIVAAGRECVMVARLEPSDVGEDDAARQVADAVLGPGLTVGPAETGRVNLNAAQPGLVGFSRAGIDAVNAVTDDVTLATLPRLAPVEAGRMVATVKIIPFAVTKADVARCVAAASSAKIEIRPFRPLSVGLIQTVDDRLKPSVVEKTTRITIDRLTRLGSRLAHETHSPHALEPLVDAIAGELAGNIDMLLVIGASAIADRRDVIPAAIERSGGRLERLGMPVDPGNLILIAEIGGVPVLGLPGCARSPARNGLDWVLERIAAGLPVGREDVARMGVGGLLIGREDEKDEQWLG